MMKVIKFELKILIKLSKNIHVQQVSLPNLIIRIMISIVLLSFGCSTRIELWCRCNDVINLVLNVLFHTVVNKDIPVVVVLVVVRALKSVGLGQKPCSVQPNQYQLLIAHARIYDKNHFRFMVIAISA